MDVHGEAGALGRLADVDVLGARAGDVVDVEGGVVVGVAELAPVEAAAHAVGVVAVVAAGEGARAVDEVQVHVV
ncbi:MAG: hypothetical protein ACK559_40515, partial [bacterium]